MMIRQPKIMFRTWLELASFRSVKFGQSFVRQNLSYEFRYEVCLNMANDDFADGDFELYPDDDDRVALYEDIDDVVTELVRNNRVPVWIDISVYKYLYTEISIQTGTRLFRTNSVTTSSMSSYSATRSSSSGYSSKSPSAKSSLAIFRQTS